MDEAPGQTHQRTDDLIVVFDIDPEADIGVSAGLRLQLLQHGCTLGVVGCGIAEKDQVGRRVVGLLLTQAFEGAQDSRLIFMDIVAGNGGQNRTVRVDLMLPEQWGEHLFCPVFGMLPIFFRPRVNARRNLVVGDL